MKRITLFIAILFIMLLSACGASKRSIEASERHDIASDNSTTEITQIEKYIDTTKTEMHKVTITEIDFFLPIEYTPGVIHANLVKSIKQTMVESDKQERGESKESTQNDIIKTEAIVHKSEIDVKELVTPASDPYKWRYIFYILLLCIVLFLYVKRTPIYELVKSSLSKVRKIL